MKVIVDIPDRMKPYLETIEKAEGEDFQALLDKAVIQSILGWHPIVLYAYENNLTVNFSKTSHKFLVGKKIN